MDNTIEKTIKLIDEVSPVLQRLAGEFEDGEITQEQYEKSIKQVEAALKRSIRTYDKHDKELKEASKSTKKATQSTDKFDKQIGDASGTIKQAVKTQDKYTKSLKGVSQSSKKASGSISDLGSSMMSSLPRTEKFGEVLGALGPIGVALGAGLGVAAIAIGKLYSTINEGLESLIDFEYGLAKISTLLDDSQTKEYLPQFEKGLMKLSAATGQTLDALSEGMYNAVSAGVATGDALEYMETASKAAIAGCTDVNVAVQGLAAVTNAYGKENITTEHASDVLFTIIKNGIVSFDELNSMMGAVAPSSAALGVSFEETGAALSLMTSKKISAAEAGTKLKALFGELAEGEANKQFEKLGIEIFDSAGKFRDFGDVMSDAMKKTEDFTVSQLMSLFGTAEAADAYIILSEKTVDATGNMVSGMEAELAKYDADKIVGATAAAWEKMDATVKIGNEKIEASYTNMTMTVAKSFMPVDAAWGRLQLAFYDGATKIAESFNTWAAESGIVASSLDAIQAVIDSVSSAAADMYDYLANSSSVQFALDAIWNALESMYAKIEVLYDVVLELWEAFDATEYFDLLFDIFGNLFNTIQNLYMPIEAIIAWLARLVGAGEDGFSTLGTIVKVFTSIMTLPLQAVNSLLSAFNQLFDSGPYVDALSSEASAAGNLATKMEDLRLKTIGSDTTIKNMTGSINTLKGSSPELANQLISLTDETGRLDGKQDGLNKKLGKMIEQRESVGGTLAALQSEFMNAANSGVNLDTVLGEINSVSPELAGKLRILVDENGKMKGSAVDATAAFDNYATANTALKNELIATKNAMFGEVQRGDNIASLITEVGNISPATAQALSNLTDSEGNLLGTAEDVNRVMKEYIEIQKEIKSQKAAEALEGMAENLEDYGNNLTGWTDAQEEAHAVQVKNYIENNKNIKEAAAELVDAYSLAEPVMGRQVELMLEMAQKQDKIKTLQAQINAETISGGDGAARIREIEEARGALMVEYRAINSDVVGLLAQAEAAGLSELQLREQLIAANINNADIEKIIAEFNERAAKAAQDKLDSDIADNEASNINASNAGDQADSTERTAQATSSINTDTANTVDNAETKKEADKDSADSKEAEKVSAADLAIIEEQRTIDHKAFLTDLQNEKTEIDNIKTASEGLKTAEDTRVAAMSASINARIKEANKVDKLAAKVRKLGADLRDAAAAGGGGGSVGGGGVPSAQTGGFTNDYKGLVYLHPNELIIPLDKGHAQGTRPRDDDNYKTLGKSIGTTISRNMNPVIEAVGDERQQAQSFDDDFREELVEALSEGLSDGFETIEPEKPISEVTNTSITTINQSIETVGAESDLVGSEAIGDLYADTGAQKIEQNINDEIEMRENAIDIVADHQRSANAELHLQNVSNISSEENQRMQAGRDTHREMMTNLEEEAEQELADETAREIEEHINITFDDMDFDIDTDQSEIIESIDAMGVIVANAIRDKTGEEEVGQTPLEIAASLVEDFEHQYAEVSYDEAAGTLTLTSPAGDVSTSVKEDTDAARKAAAFLYTTEADQLSKYIASLKEKRKEIYANAANEARDLTLAEIQAVTAYEEEIEKRQERAAELITILEGVSAGIESITTISQDMLTPAAARNTNNKIMAARAISLRGDIEDITEDVPLRGRLVWPSASDAMQGGLYTHAGIADARGGERGGDSRRRGADAYARQAAFNFVDDLIATIEETIDFDEDAKEAIKAAGARLAYAQEEVARVVERGGVVSQARYDEVEAAQLQFDQAIEPYSELITAIDENIDAVRAEAEKAVRAVHAVPAGKELSPEELVAVNTLVAAYRDAAVQAVIQPRADDPTGHTITDYTLLTNFVEMTDEMSELTAAGLTTNKEALARGLGSFQAGWQAYIDTSAAALQTASADVISYATFGVDDTDDDDTDDDDATDDDIKAVRNRWEELFVPTFNWSQIGGEEGTEGSFAKSFEDLSDAMPDIAYQAANTFATDFGNVLGTLIEGGDVTWEGIGNSLGGMMGQGLSASLATFGAAGALAGSFLAPIVESGVSALFSLFDKVDPYIAYQEMVEALKLDLAYAAAQADVLIDKWRKFEDIYSRMPSMGNYFDEPIDDLRVLKEEMADFERVFDVDIETQSIDEIDARLIKLYDDINRKKERLADLQREDNKWNEDKILTLENEIDIGEDQITQAQDMLEYKDRELEIRRAINDSAYKQIELEEGLTDRTKSTLKARLSQSWTDAQKAITEGAGSEIINEKITTYISNLKEGLEEGAVSWDEYQSKIKELSGSNNKFIEDLQNMQGELSTLKGERFDIRVGLLLGSTKSEYAKAGVTEFAEKAKEASDAEIAEMLKAASGLTNAELSSQGFAKEASGAEMPKGSSGFANVELDDQDLRGIQVLAYRAEAATRKISQLNQEISATGEKIGDTTLLADALSSVTDEQILGSLNNLGRELDLLDLKRDGLETEQRLIKDLYDEEMKKEEGDRDADKIAAWTEEYKNLGDQINLVNADQEANRDTRKKNIEAMIAYMEKENFLESDIHEWRKKLLDISNAELETNEAMLEINQGIEESLDNQNDKHDEILQRMIRERQRLLLQKAEGEDVGGALKTNKEAMYVRMVELEYDPVEIENYMRKIPTFASGGLTSGISIAGEAGEEAVFNADATDLLKQLFGSNLERMTQSPSELMRNLIPSIQSETNSEINTINNNIGISIDVTGFEDPTFAGNAIAEQIDIYFQSNNIRITDLAGGV